MKTLVFIILTLFVVQFESKKLKCWKCRFESCTDLSKAELIECPENQFCLAMKDPMRKGCTPMEVKLPGRLYSCNTDKCNESNKF